MGCVKAGAMVLFEEYGLVRPSDLHEVGDCIVIRSAKSTSYFVPCEFIEVTHKVTIGNGYYNETLGICVVPRERVKEVNRP